MRIVRSHHGDIASSFTCRCTQTEVARFKTLKTLVAALSAKADPYSDPLLGNCRAASSLRTRACYVAFVTL